MAVVSRARRAALGSLAALLFSVAVVGVSCGGQVEGETGTTDPSTPDAKVDAKADAKPDSALSDAADAGKDAKSDAKDAGKDAQVIDGGKDAAADAKNDYVDPGCPDAALPPTDFQCDPYDVNSCGEGKTCYPFVDYPDEPCGQEQYGSSCTFAGTGVQGEPCGLGCASGHICVVSGQGTQCVQMCDLNDPNPCDGGLICSAVDIPGIGGCL